MKHVNYRLLIPAVMFVLVASVFAAPASDADRNQLSEQLRRLIINDVPAQFRRAVDGIEEVLMFIKNWHHVGAIAPSSPALTEQMIAGIVADAQACLLKHPNHVFKVIDVGAGYGTFTAGLITAFEQAGVTNYHIYALEFLPEFVTKMSSIFAANTRISVIQGDITKITCATDIDHKLNHKKHFDAIVSGLPFYSDCFTANNVDQIFGLYEKLLKKNGLLRWFSYSESAGFFLGLREAIYNAKRALYALAGREISNHELEEFRAKAATIEDFKQRHNVQSVKVTRNAPPAWAHQASLGHQYNTRLQTRVTPAAYAA